MSEDMKMLKIISGRYYFKQQIDQGTHCSIYMYQDIVTQKLVAVKQFNSRFSSQLFENEVSILKYIQQLKGVPLLYDSRYQKEQYFIVQELLGNSLQKHISNFKTNTLQFTVSICFQILNILAEFHNNGVIHGNINPSHILFGNQEQLDQLDQLFLINFTNSQIIKNGSRLGNLQIFESSCKIFNQSEDHNFIPISVHECTGYSRYDDLESLLYVLIYMYKGTLPWTNQQSNTLQIKKEIQTEELCSGMPIEFKKQKLNSLIFQHSFCDFLKQKSLSEEINLKILIEQFRELDNQLKFEIPNRISINILQDGITNQSFINLDKSKTEKKLGNYNQIYIDSRSTHLIQNSEKSKLLKDDFKSQQQRNYKFNKKQLSLFVSNEQKDQEKKIHFLKEINYSIDSLEEFNLTEEKNALLTNFIGYKQTNRKNYKFIQHITSMRKETQQFS